MIKLYKVIKEKSVIRGYWLDNGKLYRDFIIIDKIKNKTKLQEGMQDLFGKGELAVFYSIDKKGYCINNQGKINVLPYRLRLHRQKLSVKEIKKLVSVFGGVTIYKLYGRYIIEVYHN